MKTKKIDIKLVVPLKYDSVKEFYGGFAEVKLNGKEIFIDWQGNEVNYPKESQ